MAVEHVDDVTRQLLVWLSSILPGSACVIAGSTQAEPAMIEVALQTIRPRAAPTSAAAPLELELVYVCRAPGADILAGQRCLGEVAFAALGGQDWGVAALPDDNLGLYLTARLLRARQISRGPLVRERLKLHAAAIVPGSAGQRSTAEEE